MEPNPLFLAPSFDTDAEDVASGSSKAPEDLPAPSYTGLFSEAP